MWTQCGLTVDLVRAHIGLNSTANRWIVGLEREDAGKVF